MPEQEREKYITESGIYLNPYKDSRNYLEPLPEHRYFKSMYGIVAYPGFKDPAFTVLEWSNKLAENIPEHEFETMYKFRATQRTSESIRRLGGTKATKFIRLDRELTREDKEELIKKLGPFKEFSKLSSYYDLIGKKKAAQEVILIQAGIRTIGKSEKGYVATFEAPEDDFASPVTGFIPDFVPLNFGRNSIVLALGTLFRDSRDRLCMNVLGIFPTVQGYLAPDSDLLES